MKCYFSLGLLTLATIWSANPSVADEQLTQRDNPLSTPRDQIIAEPTPDGNLMASGQYNVKNFSVGGEAYVNPNGEDGDRVIDSAAALAIRRNHVNSAADRKVFSIVSAGGPRPSRNQMVLLAPDRAR